MNKYKVTRDVVYKGSNLDHKEYETEAESLAKAVSKIRYKTTKTDEMPNGELTDYYDDFGRHVLWGGYLISESVIDEINKDDVKLEKPTETKTSDFIQIKVTGETADRFRKLKSDLGLDKNTDTLARLIDIFEVKDDVKVTHREVFILPDKLKANTEKYAEIFNCKVEDIYFRAVKFYIEKLGKMTLGELVEMKERANNGHR